jgi:predicted permease
MMGRWGWSTGRRKRMMEDLDQDVCDFIERETQDNIDRGMPPDEARYAALRKFGNVTQVKEETWEVWSFVWLEQLWQDIRFGVRMLAKNPGFAAVAVLTLALGIGANTAIFSLIDAVMLKTLPVKNPEQLVLLSWVSPQDPGGEIWMGGDLGVDSSGRETSHGFSYPTFEELQRSNGVFSSFFGFDSFASVNISAEGRADYAEDELVSGDYFSGLGVVPILGRPITPKDEGAEAPCVTVISHGLWSRQFGRSPAAVGKSITINGVSCTIVGVVPSQFFGVTPGRAVDVWVPLVQDSMLPWGTFRRANLNASFNSPTHWWVDMMGRLKPGVTAEQARAQLELLFQQSRAGLNARAKPQSIPHVQLESAAKGLASLREEFSTPLRILTVVVGIVLLIACTNIAALLLARSAARQQEIALRLSLGASRARLTRQLLTESILLAGLGGAAGVLIAHWTTPAFVLLMSSGRQALNLSVKLDAKVLAFTAAVSTLTGILFGLAPALRSVGVDLSPALKAGARSAGAPGKRTRMGLAKSLVIIQVALALLLSIGAGLLVRTLKELEGQSLGFDQDHLLLFRVHPELNGYEGERLMDFYARLRARLQALPGVKSVTMSFLPPFSGWANQPPISVEGYESGPWKTVNSDWDNVGPSFFDTMGIPVTLGRGIETRDSAGSPKVAVVNEAFAHEAFGDLNPIGRRVKFGFSWESNPEYEIVGVVKNARLVSLRRVPLPAVYTPYAQMPALLASLNFELRTAGDPLALIPTVRRAVRDIDPDMPIADVRTQTQQIAGTLMQERLLERLSSFFGGIAILLACIGLYGLISYAANQRTHEIGIRRALGAQRRDVLRMVVGQGFKLALLGLASGGAGALALTRYITSQLYGVKPNDPVTFVTVTLLVLAVTLLASYLPARRATKVDPMVALRYE